MRIDLPSCPLKSCRYQNDGNCTDAKDYENCILRDMIQIPQNATTSDVIRTLFPDYEVYDGYTMVYYGPFRIDKSFWEAPFKRESEKV